MAPQNFESRGLPPSLEEALTRLNVARTQPWGQGPSTLPGAVALAWSSDRLLAHEALGDALLYDERGGLLPAPQRAPMRLDTVFDIASLTKLFTAALALQQYQAGAFDLDQPVADHLPDFAAHGKGDITISELLTHTSGLQWWLPLWSDWSTPAERRAAVLASEPVGPRGGQFVYSDLNLITVGLLLEQVTGAPLDALLRRHLTEPLGLRDTGFITQLTHLEQDRFAATEIQDDAGRGLVRGQVHDENAWSLGGVSGHAGIFSTASDLLRFARCILNGGNLDGTAVLSEDSIARMTTDLNTDLPQDAHGLGFEIDQPRYMGELSGPRTVGHTGFTGTSLVIDTERAAVAILLSNAVHPRRPLTPINALRASWATGLARSLPGTAHSGDQR